MSQVSHWKDRLTVVEDAMRSISQESDPQELVQSYGQKIQQLMPIDRRLSLSRRDLNHPEFRITRSTTWEQSINPWSERDELPLLRGGILADVCDRNETTLIDDLRVYTDGITKTHKAANEQFGESRIDDVLSKCGLDSAELMRNLLTAVDEFANGVPPHDDRTVIVLRAT
jgi:hypothetical protein